MKTGSIFTIIIAIIIVAAILFIAFGIPSINKATNTNNMGVGQANPSPTSSSTITNTPTQTQVQSGAGEAQTHTIDISNFAFSPKTLNIKVGDTVVWTNKDSSMHTVTSNTGKELSSPTLSKGNTYSHTFNNAGTFDYHCTFHSTMMGEIVVG